MRRTDFSYHLPEGLIAQYPAERRRGSRMLSLDGDTGRVVDGHFTDFVDQLQAGDLVIFNNTRVIPARLYGNKSTGGKVEILVERIEAHDTALAHVKASKSPRSGSRIAIGETALEVLGRQGELFRLKFPDIGVMRVLDDHGHIPLPGYIDREDTVFDGERYQTVYAKRCGAVAAPTAGLHFDTKMMDEIAARGIYTAFVTLHVGAGTFRPVRVDELRDHRMHAEWLEVTPEVCARVATVKQAGKRVIAIGTTSVRSLEAAATSGELRPFRGETRLFITPGYEFRVVDGLLTNFHLPESTLLMLVSAFAGHGHVMRAYRHAVERRYRFFSYGDAMWLTRTRLAS